MHRTPPQTSTSKKPRASASPSAFAISRASVRKSAGEWEKKAEINRPLNQTYTQPSHSQQTKLPLTKTTVQHNLAKPTEEQVEEDNHEQSDSIKEGRKWAKIAKQYVGESRNLKTDLKNGILKAIDNLYQIIKNGDQGSGRKKEATVHPITQASQEERNIEKKLEAHGNLLKQHLEEMKTLRETIVRTSQGTETGEQILENTGMLKKSIMELAERVTSITHASSTANEPQLPANQDTRTSPHFAVIVSSDTIENGSDELMKRVRTTLDAKGKGLQIQSVKQIRDERVVVRCNSKKEIEKVAQQLRKDKDLEVAETKNKNPLVVLKNVMAYNSDEEIVTALVQQNRHLMEDLSAEERNATVKYRRRVRNPHENHVILEVSPKLWRRLTETGRVYIDVQRVRVADQTPLVQCSKCLAYGHGRRLCVEEAETCHHCGGPHVRQECPDRLAGSQQTCSNCKSAKNSNDRHAVFSDDCPIRKKFDALARQTIAYC